MSKIEVWENRSITMIVSMTSRIEELAGEASDPNEAGQKMRQLYFTHCKLTKRQLTVDILRKLLERGVGTHDVESIAQKVIKGEPRRNPEIQDQTRRCDKVAKSHPTSKLEGEG